MEELYLEDLCGEKLPEAAASTLQALGCPDLVDPKVTRTFASECVSCHKKIGGRPVALPSLPAPCLRCSPRGPFAPPVPALPPLLLTCPWQAAKLSRQLCQLRTGSGRPQISDAAARLGASLAVNAGLAGAGAVLVFVPGLAEIGVLREALQEEAAARGAEESLHGCVLHSLVPASEQEVAMRPPPTGCFKVRRLILTLSMPAGPFGWLKQRGACQGAMASVGLCSEHEKEGGGIRAEEGVSEAAGTSAGGCKGREGQTQELEPLQNVCASCV